LSKKTKLPERNNFKESTMRNLMVSLLIAVSVISCASNPKASEVSDFKDKDWKLVEVWLDGKNVNFNRKELDDRKVGEFFTLKLDAETLSGTGAPNRYSAPYSLDGKKIKTMPVRATLMAALWEPEQLKEHDYFLYIQNISEWAIVGDRLELTSKTKDGHPVKLVFAL
jgi:heat shock protein HslJ